MQVLALVERFLGDFGDHAVGVSPCIVTNAGDLPGDIDIAAGGADCKGVFVAHAADDLGPDAALGILRRSRRLRPPCLVALGASH